MRVLSSIAAVVAFSVLVAGKAQEGSRLQTGSNQGAEISEELRAIMEKCRPRPSVQASSSPECQELRAKLTQMRGGMGPSGSDDDADDVGSGSGMRPRKGPKDGKRDGKGKKGKGKGKGGHEGGADHKAGTGEGQKGKGKGGPEGNHGGEPQGQHGGGGGGGLTHAEKAGAAAGVIGLIVVVVAAVVVAVRKSRRSRAPRLSLTNAAPSDCTKPPAYVANVPVVEATAVDYREVNGAQASRVLNNANYARPGSIC